MALHVSTLAGEVEVETPPGASVATLRAEVAGKLQVPPALLDLLDNGKSLEDAELLAEGARLTAVVSSSSRWLVLEWSPEHVPEDMSTPLAAGNTPHTIAVQLTWPAVEEYTGRVWILTLGEEEGAHHWLWNPWGRPACQIGVWNGAQLQRPLKSPPGKKQHLTTTFDGRKLCLYVDGALHDQVEAEFRFQAVRPALRVFKEEDTAANGESGSNCDIHHVAVFSRALGPEEVAALAREAGTMAAVGGPRPPHVPVPFTWVPDAPPAGRNLPLGPGNVPHTIAARLVWPDEAPSDRTWILNLGQEEQGGHHWLWGPGDKCQLGAHSGRQSCKPLPAALGKPVHLATSFDGELLAVYVDGAVHETVGSSFNFWGDRQALALHGSGSTFPGKVLEVTIWDRALSASEISALAGATPSA